MIAKREKLARERSVDSTTSAVIVSYRTPELLVGCLRRLRAEGVVQHVVVVDNASGDDSCDSVSSNFPDVELIPNAKNIGFARAVNQGVQRTASKYVLLLNPDAEIDRGAVDTLSRYLDENPAVAIVGPAIRHPTGRLRILSAGKQPTLWRLVTHATALSRLSRQLPILEGMNLIAGVHDDRARDVEWASGACMLIRRDVFDSVGGLSERWFMYAEDFELCLRVRDAGWRVVHLPSATVAHHMGASTALVSKQSTAWATTLQDFYRRDLSANAIAARCWQLAFAGFLMSRAGYYAARSCQRNRPTEHWNMEARRFAHCAAAIMRRDAPPDPLRDQTG